MQAMLHVKRLNASSRYALIDATLCLRAQSKAESHVPAFASIIRYLVYRPYLYCGMGNRLRGFQGVLFLAMATDRALMVDWYGGIRDRTKLEHKFESEGHQ